MENRRFRIFSSCLIATAIATAGCSSTKPFADRSAPPYRSERQSAPALSTPADPEWNGVGSLSDYLRYAALHNSGLEAEFNRWKAALERIPQVRTLPDPRFNYGYFIREVETRVGPQRQRFGLAQTFPWFGKLRLKGEVAGEEANAESRVNRQNTLMADLEMALYRWRDAQRKIDLFGQTLTPLARQNLNVARRAWESGRSDFLEVIDAGRQLLEFQLEADRAQRLAEIEKLVGKQYAPNWKRNGSIGDN